jgi:hypothetical protein
MREFTDRASVRLQYITDTKGHEVLSLVTLIEQADRRMLLDRTGRV